MKNFKRLLTGTAMAAVALALAACQTNQADDYRFEVVGTPIKTDSGITLTVHLARADGSPVTSAVLYADHWVHTGAKAGQSSKNRVIPLQTDGRGNYTYASNNLHTGDTLGLAARIPPDSSLIWGSVEVR
jgi:hypothetical protein